MLIFLRILALVMSLSVMGSGVVAHAEDSEEITEREPAAAKKKSKKEKKAKKAKARKEKKKAAKTAVRKTRQKNAGGGQKSHYPTQPGGTGGLPELSNEQKDDLPPPVNTEPKDE